MKKEANLTAVMIVQQLEKEYWLSDDYITSLEEAKTGNCQSLLETIVKRLKEKNIVTTEAYIIKHDKDKIQIWDEDKKEYVVENKQEHIHALLKFEKGASLNKLSLAIAVEPQYLQKLKSGRHSYDNCLAYLVHAKDETKYQYNAEEVITLKGESYVSIYNRNLEKWHRGRATRKAKDAKKDVDWLIEKILASEVSKQHIMLTDEYYQIYAQEKRKINEALDTAGERKSYRTIQQLENEEFKKTILFITAKSGVGKTRYSKELIRLIQDIAKKNGENWDFCVTASTNAFDQYHGQEILFLDDIRAESLSVSDWLKLLDPFMISPVSARYHNKLGSAKVIIITSTKYPSRFFFRSKKQLQ